MPSLPSSDLDLRTQERSIMRWGAIVRGEDRGLGIMSRELCRNLRPDRTLLLELGDLARGFAPHPEWYPGATVLSWDGEPFDVVAEATVRGWLEGLDAVYTAETWYDHRIVDWAREAGVRTIQQCMPEFWRADLRAPDVVWNPTPWRMEHLPEGTRLVPVPVAADRFPLAPPVRDEGQPLRVLHVAGHRAAADRNGTGQLLLALRRVRQPMTVRLLCQDPRLPVVRRLGAHVTLEVETGGRADYWRLYDDADVLVLPRRYGGLSLVVQEAMAAGLAVVMSDCAPNDWWPTLRVAAPSRSSLDTPGGKVAVHAANPAALAGLLDALAVDPERVRAAQDASVAWARSHTWQALLPLYMAELERAADLVVR